MRWALLFLALCACTGKQVKEPASDVSAEVHRMEEHVAHVEGRIVSFMPGGARDVYVADIGADDGVAVGDRGIFACTDAVFEVTWVQRKRAKLEIDRALMPKPGEKRVRVALAGASPEPWCPER